MEHMAMLGIPDTLSESLGENMTGQHTKLQEP